ncbi:hypothetical protein AEAC466_00765 [Asticcacaulis sp. AC466]|uniref:hypothetical protein n=1 Tax=Asticcacaulis sp. AC466 TaxID=1282362 RepID=UPI0003C3D867|nr:hypothetical protein [Asticcacaulis sp. AC466]ESQ85736.1 hypothetical protein AEAC466_00765 [Asticcacaulis sp. AC466]
MISALILSAALMAPAQDLPDGPQPYQAPAAQAPQNVPQNSPILSPSVTNGDVAPPATARSGGAISVDAYRRDYEGPKDSRELSYDSGLLSAYVNKEKQIGNMEGSWVVTTLDGRKLVGLELRSDNLVSGRLEGAWRSMLAGFGMNNSGFISDINMTGRDFEINYFAGGARSPTILHFTKGVDGRWGGYMLDTTGHKTPVTLTQVRMGN